MVYNPSCRYLYIYNTIDEKPYSQIVNHFMSVKQDKINIIPFDKIKTNEIINYKIIIIDYLVILNKNIENNINIFYNLLQCINKLKIKLCFHLHDLHSYTFLNHLLKKLKKYDQKSVTAIMNRNGNSAPDLKNLTEGIIEFLKQIQMGNVKYIISYYQCPELNVLLDYSKKLIKKNFIIPFHIEPSIFYDYKLEKKYDILLYGAYTNLSYSFRNRLYFILKSLDKKYRIKITSTSKYESELPKMINSSWLTIATTSNFSYLVRKYFEISACKSVILGNMNLQGSEIWKNNYIHIDNEMGTDMIIKIIDDALTNKEKLKDISNIMYSKIHSEYSYVNYYNKILNVYNYINNDN